MPATIAVPTAVTRAAHRLAANDALVKKLQREIEADKLLLKEWGEDSHETSDGVVTVSAVITTEVDADVARELLGTRQFNSKVRSDKVDLKKWRDADIPDSVRASAETEIPLLRLRVHH